MLDLTIENERATAQCYDYPERSAAVDTFSIEDVLDFF
jgi:hypothetical protein